MFRKNALKSLYWRIVEPREQIYRCRDCGSLFTQWGISHGLHVTHKIKFAVRTSFIEWLTIKMGLIYIFQWIELKMGQWLMEDE